MAKLHTTLADDMQDFDRYKLQSLKSDTPKRIRHAHRMVLDDLATVMAIHISTVSPKKIDDLLHLCEPPFPSLWVEMSSRVVMRCRREIMMGQGATYEEALARFKNPQSEQVRMGVFIERREYGIEAWCVEHDHDTLEVFDWPMHFELAIDGEKFERPKKDDIITDSRGVKVTHRGKTPLLSQTGLLWGYLDDQVGLRNLNHKARALVPSYAMPIYSDKEAKNKILEELTGFPRMAVGILALINAMPMVREKVTPKGRRMNKNRKGTKPLLSHTVATMVVPKRVKDVTKYVNRQVSSEVAKKRYHEVRGHYRHLKEKPSTPGWKEVVVNGETLWRKHIASHHRGDISLGMVEHDETVVKGS